MEYVHCIFNVYIFVQKEEGKHVEGEEVSFQYCLGMLVRKGSLSMRAYNKGKAIPLQAWTGPEGPRRLRLTDFKTFGT